MPDHDFDEDDFDLFRQSMSDVKPLGAQNKLPRQAPTKKPRSRQPKDSINTDAFSFAISDHEPEAIEPESFLSFQRDGLQARYFRKLRLGQLPVEALIDLHGKTIDAARDALLNFVRKSHQQGLRTVLIIHGKGRSKEKQKSILKSKINAWLRQLPVVLAFCSAQPEHGGTGAVYVLLRKNTLR